MTAALFAVAAVLAGAVSLFAAAAWLRSGAYVALVAAMMALWWTALGHPRPALFGVPKGTVLSYALNEPKDIEVIVKPKSGGDPVLWALPWNEADAAALQQAAQEAKAEGRPLAMRGRQSGGRHRPGTGKHAGPVFYPAPPPSLAPKQRP